MTTNTITILTELAQELDIDISTPVDGRLVILTKDNIKKYIIDYRWPTHDASTECIVNNKIICNTILSNEGISCLDMVLFTKSTTSSNQYTSDEERLTKNYNEEVYYKKYTDQAEEYGYPVVCKLNIGSSGQGVFKCNNKSELEKRLKMFFNRNNGLSLSPFYKIESEYRVTVLDGVAELVYSKERPTVNGDGRTTLINLIRNKYPDRFIDLESINPTYIPLDNEEVLVTWKHNLSLGSTAVVITDETLNETLSTLALQASNAVGINFASVDIVKVNGEYKVMEINSGIIPEMFTEQGDTEKIIFKNIFRKALNKLFKIQ